MFEQLRAWRAAAAKEQGVPAYVIFHDATLRQIAAQSPSTLAELATISGVGETKLAKYGQQILDLLGELNGRPGKRWPGAVRRVSVRSNAGPAPRLRCTAPPFFPRRTYRIEF